MRRLLPAGPDLSYDADRGRHQIGPNGRSDESGGCNVRSLATIRNVVRQTDYSPLIQVDREPR